MGADLRSLALFRIALGGVLLVDVVLRTTDLVAHYTDAGVLPRSDLIRVAEQPLWFSVHMGSGQWAFQAALFLLAALAATALVLGWRTRWAALISWFLLCSVQARNPMVLNSGDVLLRVLLLWGIFLPWGRLWSLDSRGQAPPRSLLVADASTLAYTLQIVLLYLTAGLHKSGEAWRNGTAVYYALSIDQFTTPLGERLLHYPGLMSGLSYAVVAFQLSVPLLVFIPWKNGLFRTLAVLGTVSLHLGIASCMHLGIFSGVATVAALGLLPSAIWPRPKIPLEGAPPPTLPRPASLLVGLLMLLNLGWNLHNLWPRVPAPRFIPLLFRMDQHWGMFAPQPLSHDGWYVREGELANGRVVDLTTGQDLNWDKPPHVADTYKNERWRKYLMSLYEMRGTPHRAFYCRYLGRVWNQTHRGPWRVKVVKLWFMRELTLPDGATAPVEKVLMARYLCEDEDEGGFEKLFGPYPYRR